MNVKYQSAREKMASISDNSDGDMALALCLSHSLRIFTASLVALADVKIRLIFVTIIIPPFGIYIYGISNIIIGQICGL